MCVVVQGHYCSTKLQIDQYSLPNISVDKDKYSLCLKPKMVLDCKLNCWKIGGLMMPTIQIHGFLRLWVVDWRDVPLLNQIKSGDQGVDE